MRQLTAAVAVAGLLVAGCGDSSAGDTAASSSTTTTASPKTPLAKAALPDLMLSPDDIDSALGTRGTTSDPPFTNLGEDPVHRTDYTFPPECKYTIHAGLVSEYADSGSTGVYGYHDIAPTPPRGNQLESPDVYQFVVLYPSPSRRTPSSPRHLSAGPPAPTARTPSPPTAPTPSFSGRWGRCPTPMGC